MRIKNDSLISSLTVLFTCNLILYLAQARPFNQQHIPQQKHRRHLQSVHHNAFNKDKQNKQQKTRRQLIIEQQSINCTIDQYNNSTSINLGNCEQELYYIAVGIGSPPQYFNFQFDTGSNVFWVSTTSANLIGFNSSASSTYKNTSQPYQQQYINGGKIQGSLGSDIVYVLNTSINVTYNIVFADQVIGLNLPDGVIGVIGMGYTSPLKSPNFLDVAYQNNLISSNIFTLNLLNTAPSSQLYYNIIPDDIMSKSLFSSVTGNFYWQVQLIGLIAGLYDLTQFAAEVAVIDSGTSLFYLNPTLTTKFISQFLPSSLCNFTDGLNICNCSILSSLPNLTFMFIGVAVQLTPFDYVQAFGSTCYVHIYSVTTTPAQILLGDTLFLQYLITFNKNEGNIGFNGNTKIVYTFGNDPLFVNIEYGMISLNILIFIAIILAAILCKQKNNIQNKQKQQVIKQRMTQLSQFKTVQQNLIKEEKIES